jgi:hypothetical protein
MHNCKIAIRTSAGHYLTAVNGGGMGEAANVLPLHTDAGKLGPWEQFKIRFHSDGFCTIQTQNGHYLTAVNGGGIADSHNIVSTDRNAIRSWETFTIEHVGKGLFAFRTAKGTYLTAVGGGGKGEAANKLPLHTDATKIGGWEKFIVVPVKEYSRKPK